MKKKTKPAVSKTSAAKKLEAENEALRKQVEDLKAQLPPPPTLGKFGVKDGSVVMTEAASIEGDESAKSINTEFFSKHEKNIHRIFKDK